MSKLILSTLIAFGISSQAFAAKKKYDKCENQSWIIMINTNNETPKAEIVKAMELIGHSFVFNLGPFVVPNDTGFIINIDLNTKEPTSDDLEKRDAALSGLERLTDVVVECNETMEPMPRGSISN